MPLSNIDSASLANLLGQLAAEGGQAVEADLKVLQGRFPSLPWYVLLAALAAGGGQSVTLKDGLSTILATVTGVLGGFNALATVATVGSGLNPAVPRLADVFKNGAAFVSGTYAAPVAFWTPAAGKRFRLLGGFFSAAVAPASGIALCDNIAANEFMRLPVFGANTPFTLPPLGNGFLSAAANNALVIGAAGQTLTGVLFGTEE
jgi:hypothetical protein